MKKTLLFLSLAAILLFSCGKEQSLEGFNSSAITGDFRAKIEGVDWVANLIKSAKRENGQIILYGSAGDKKSITLIVKDSGVHSYVFPSNSLENVAVFQDSLITPFATWSTNQWLMDGIFGDLNITRIDTVSKRMSGTFSINVYRSFDDLTRTITNGFFNNIPFTQGTTNVLQDTFKVKLDGNVLGYNNVSTSSLIPGTLSIVVMQNNGNSLLITFPEFITPGGYVMDGSTGVDAVYTEGTNVYSSDAGTFQVISHDVVNRRIRASFNFTATDVLTGTSPILNFTEGYLSLSY